MDMSEIKSLVESQGKAWEEFKKTNDERIAALASNKAVSDLDGKLAKMESEITESSKALKELTLKTQRPNLSGDAQTRAEAELKSFNNVAQAAAMESGKTFTPLTADGLAAYKEAKATYLRRGIEGLSESEKKAINVGTSSQGGFLIDHEMEAGIDRVVSRYSALRQVARVIPIGSASYKKLVKVTGTSGATRGGETTAPTNGTTQTWVELEFKPGTYLSEQRITSEAIEDATFSVESDLIQEVGIEIAELQAQDGINGDGVNGLRGMQSYDIVANASYQWGKVGYVATGHASAFASSSPSDYLIDLQHALKRQYRANGAWIMNDLTLAAIRKFKDGQGNYLWGNTAPSNLMAGAVGTLLGHPVVTDDFMPDLGANAYPVAFGDFNRAYYIVDRKGVSVLRDPAGAFPYVRFLSRTRSGGGIANFEALKFLKCAVS